MGLGAKSASIWYVDAPDPAALLREHRTPDPAAGAALANLLFPDLDVVDSGAGLIALDDGAIESDVCVGWYPGVTVVHADEVSLPRPSTLAQQWIRPLASERTYLVATDDTHSWGAFAYWERGALRRAFSATDVHIIEDEGLPLVWERPFWAGEHPIVPRPGELPDPQSLPFDPQAFAAAALTEWLGADAGRVLVCAFTLYEEGARPMPSIPVPATGPRKFKWRRRKVDSS